MPGEYFIILKGIKITANLFTIFLIKDTYKEFTIAGVE
jgi:hypothetical protein